MRLVLAGEPEEAGEETGPDLTRAVPGKKKITNCGGVWPGSRGTGFAGCFGCLPVKEVEPSPIRRPGREEAPGLSDAPGSPDREPPPPP